MVRAGWSPSVRLFEAAACGVPIISDRWEGLGSFFRDGTEILVVDSTDRVLALLEGLRPEIREAIGRAARARVLEGHTADHRARELEDHVAAVRATTGARGTT
jgi:spore maturation protein CgeB